jgi:F-type H+-transporting ATPase subunit b
MLATSLVLAATPGADPELQLLPDMAELLWGTVAFALLMVFMFKFVFPKMNAALDERSALIQGRMQEAEVARAEADQVRSQYEAQVADSRAEANRIVDEARAQAERLRVDAVARAEEEAAQIRARALDEVAAERGRLVSELRGHFAAISVELAGKIVQRELDEQQHRALVDQYINELSGLN